MSEETSIAEVAAVAGDEQQSQVIDSEVKTSEVSQETNDDGTPKEAEKPEVKPEKTPEERERIRMQRGIDRKTRQAAEARARAEAAERRIAELEARLTPQKIGVDYQSESGDSEQLTLTKAEAQRLIEDEARKLAPTIAKQVATEEQLRRSAIALKQELGDEFDELTDELDEVLPKDKQLALLSVKNPAPLVRYLADPENSAEVELLARMSDFQAGIAIASLQDKLARKAASEKPEPSNVPKPLEAVKAQGTVNNAPDPVKNPKAWIRWANEEEARAR